MLFIEYYFPRWRFSAASIFSLAKERLEPLLNEAKPGILGKSTLCKYMLRDLRQEREREISQRNTSKKLITDCSKDSKLLGHLTFIMALKEILVFRSIRITRTHSRRTNAMYHSRQNTRLLQR